MVLSVVLAGLERARVVGTGQTFVYIVQFGIVIRMVDVILVLLYLCFVSDDVVALEPSSVQGRADIFSTDQTRKVWGCWHGKLYRVVIPLANRIM